MCCPVVIAHSEVSFGSLPSGRSAASPFGFDGCFHGIIIWVPIKNTILYFVCGQIKPVSLECTQQLGVMTQQKTPAQPCRANRGENKTRLSPDPS